MNYFLKRGAAEQMDTQSFAEHTKYFDVASLVPEGKTSTRCWVWLWSTWCVT